MTEQLTEAQAIAFHDDKLWEPLTLRQRAEFQLTQDRLCMPFDVFHEAIQKTLGRPVFTHEFGLDREGLTRELFGERPAPTFREIMDLMPAEKRLLLVIIKPAAGGGSEHGG